MNTLLSLARTFLPDGVLRARVLQQLRTWGAAAGVLVLAWTVAYIKSHFPQIADADATAIATTIAAAVSGLIVSVGSAIFAWLDPIKVDATVKAAQAQGASQAAAAIGAGQTTPADITAASGSPAALAKVLAALASGKE